MAKKYDLAVKTGSYTDSAGETKNRYLNIGAVMEGQNGFYMLLNKTFNPAGVPDEGGRDNIIVSMFEPKTSGGGSTPAPATPPTPPAQPQLEDVLPF